MRNRAGAIVRVAIVEDDLETLERFARAISSDTRTIVVKKARTGGKEMPLHHYQV